jgi:hypothetical protein
MTQLLAAPKKEAAKKRNRALVAWTGTAVIGAWTLSPALIGLGAILSGFLTFKWLKHRGKWGLRF